METIVIIQVGNSCTYIKNLVSKWLFFIGNVLFQTRDQAKLYNLTYIDNQQRAIIKVDNTTDGTKDPNYGRASVYMISNEQAPLGSLVLMDADHLPFGVSESTCILSGPS